MYALLWVLAWGRSLTWLSAASFAIRARLRSTISSSTTATGVMMPSVAARMRSTSIGSALGAQAGYRSGGSERYFHLDHRQYQLRPAHGGQWRQGDLSGGRLCA